MFFTLIFPMATHAQEVKTEPLADDVYQRQPYDISPDIMHDMISAPDTLHLPRRSRQGDVAVVLSLLFWRFVEQLATS